MAKKIRNSRVYHTFKEYKNKYFPNIVDEDIDENKDSFKEGSRLAEQSFQRFRHLLNSGPKTN